ncbi:MAG TPA: glycerophosphoryl diester phosphodiesterase membrane domain-containing protein [Vicinamibacterales bacterium]|jgi:hypothetical protein
MALDLRPLTLGELLDRSFGLYRRHFWLFVGIMGVPSLLGLAFGILTTVFTPQPPSPESMASTTPDPGEILRTVIFLVAAMVGMGIVYFITYAVALGATTVAVSELYMGRPITIRGSFTPLRGKVGRLALLLLLVSLRTFGVLIVGAVSVGVSAAVVAAGSPIIGVLVMTSGVFGAFVLWIWLILRYAVAVPAAVLEDETATDAIRRSIQLTRGSLWRVGVLLVFTMIITYGVLLIFQGPFVFAAALSEPGAPMAFWMNLFGTIFGSIGGAFTAPLMVVAFAVLYYDLRVRHEGLDLQMMLANLGVESGVGGAGVVAPPA